eukprot:scaffold29586_cov164-Isochrysis_galbana.AAC.1
MLHLTSSGRGPLVRATDVRRWRTRLKGRWDWRPAMLPRRRMRALVITLVAGLGDGDARGVAVAGGLVVVLSGEGLVDEASPLVGAEIVKEGIGGDGGEVGVDFPEGGGGG